MHKPTAFSSCILIGVSLAACTGVNVNRVTSYDQPGIRYWRPAPYIALQRTTDKDGKSSTCEAKMLTLPDKSEEYAITINAGLGAAKVNPTLTDGWRLDAITNDLDSKTADNLNAVANLIKGAAEVVPKAKVAGKGGGVVDRCAGLYRVNYDEAGHISGFTSIQLR
jgi:hypothetical protein